MFPPIDRNVMLLRLHFPFGEANPLPARPGQGTTYAPVHVPEPDAPSPTTSFNEHISVNCQEPIF